MACVHASAQVMQRLTRVGRRQDYWVVNFGLHYSPAYRQELEQLVSEVFPPFFQEATRAVLTCCEAGRGGSPMCSHGMRRHAPGRTVEIQGHGEAVWADAP